MLAFNLSNLGFPPPSLMEVFSVVVAYHHAFARFRFRFRLRLLSCTVLSKPSTPFLSNNLSHLFLIIILPNREEVDGIILVQLRQIGADIPEDCTTIKTLEVEGLVDGCARCINAIINDEEKAVRAYSKTSPI